MIALLPVRRGLLPAGGLETARRSGRALLVGDGTGAAASLLGEALPSEMIETLELGAFAPAAYARELAGRLAAHEIVVLPASPDGRDLAPRLAHQLGRPLLAGAVEIERNRATVLRRGGRQLVELECEGPFVATYEAAARQSAGAGAPDEGQGPSGGGGEDPVVLGALPPDPSSVDLSEADRILGIGAGSASPAALETARGAASLLGASLGATRVVTDSGAIDHRRQIGTTGVSVHPRLYLAFGISGAAQHVAGLGEPAHVVAVNTDPSCPMMALADLAVVSDAEATLGHLRDLLEKRRAGG